MFFKVAARGLPVANSLKLGLAPGLGYGTEDRPLKYQSSAD
jgi:hypothetical protein